MKHGAVPDLLRSEPGLLVCPACAAALQADGEAAALRCAGCGRRFELDSGIPLLFWRDEPAAPGGLTERVKSFYEETPFPDYEGLDTAGSLKRKARQGVFARLLDEQVPAGARILEAGCGTGQLSNFLALAPGRTVVATDMCLNSLKLAQRFKEDNGIDSVTFVQMDLFRPVVAAGSFDLVIANGVLHHTGDPCGGFRALGGLVREGGYVVVGLYNRIGRLPTDLRRLLFRLSGNRLGWLDPRLRGTALGQSRKRTWFLDQYRNPHESKHTIGEVLGWFRRSGFEFVSGIPKTRAFEPFASGEKLFRRRPAGSPLDHLLVQLGLIFSGNREGGLFVMIGRKTGSASGA